ncbi:hypothetical protein ABB37_02345 [Leptomonas pyrrhocoris]|uniref:GRIP domain-containing protein n=1 Tax=Leptomonas pyrrhocoris TaxID=157538 RepID=A0A0N0DYR7_LEPPY|nr:hypothetical protein ABB37_02345 [Leptomonas pyrrhocoris]XP_015662781.1 hypothetical protein ABB37_02345 [Leptomonas pyrrhocoris]XP_015662782.1 hypothetical protein ABB37_02345 [Leptomonas pyrrhocoris]KPA84341.1 hypothetical protein ABB37_02345 [Leptomonas pyrrhocoris]KPA84342.1 hypothetical protein ABB37_02345 [Leptomonas pyrrhocoris]KPA84343.1 hypothetical protein ABB37_02345 [Leptomonas pyrrhocoris]|eukprot:XP_015662780.1 hypothetical protein ABB37_02345 [Leptomonas pyrrhocoris]
MWKEWTKKIKTFAEDITSPEYDDERRDGAAYEEEETEEGVSHHVDDSYNNHHAPRGHTSAPPASHRRVHDTHVDGNSLLFETPARSLERHFDEPTVERKPGVTPQHLPRASAQSSPAVETTAAASHAPAVVGHRSNCDEGEEEEEADGFSRLSSSSTVGPAPPAVVAGEEKPQAERPTSTKASLPPPSAGGAPRRGPPPAMTTPQLQRQQHQSPAQAQASSTAATPAAVALPLSSCSTPADKAGLTDTNSTPAVTHLSAPQERRASVSSQPLHPKEEEEKTALAHTPHLSTSAASTSPQHQQPQQRRRDEWEEEKMQMLVDIRNYQEEVRVAHEQTVAYYEAQIKAAQQATSDAVANAKTTQEQRDSLQAALRTADKKLEKEQVARAALEQQVKQLTQAAEEARARMIELQGKLNTAASAPLASHTNAEWAEKEKECVEWRAKLLEQEREQQAAQAQLRQSAEAARQTLEEQLREAHAQLAALQISSTASAAAATSEHQMQRAESSLLVQQEEKLATLQAQLDTWKHRAGELKERLEAAQTHADYPTQHRSEDEATNTAAHHGTARSPSSTSLAEVEQLKQQLQSTEAARRALETQLQEAQRELTSTFPSSNQQQQAHQAPQAEELEAMTLELESARQRAEALTQALATAETQKQSLTSQLAEEQAKRNAVHSSATAASTDEVRRLSDQLQVRGEQCNTLQREVQQAEEMIHQLTGRLAAEAKAHKEAVAQLEEYHAEAEGVLEDEIAGVRAAAAKEKQKLDEQLRRSQAELQQLQKRVAHAEDESKAANKARGVAESNATALEKERAALQRQLQQHQDDLAQQQQEWKRLAEREANSGAGISLAALTSVKRELEDKVQALEVTVDQVRRMTVDTLVRLGVDIAQAVQPPQPKSSNGGVLRNGTQPPQPQPPPSSSKTATGDNKGTNSRSRSRSASNSDNEEGNESQIYTDKRRRKAQDALPLLQLFSLLTTECLQQHNIVLRAERVQQEWEQTYEQARQVNESLNQQIADAWATIGKLREEASVKDAAARQMQSRVGSGDARLLEVQEELTRVTAEVEQLREERTAWTVRLQQADAGAEGQERTLASLQEELQSLQSMLKSKDEELQSSQQSLENLQMVLDRFQETKRHEVEALTLEAHLEAENLKTELEKGRRVMEQHDQTKEALHQRYEAQLAAKDAEVTTLYRKLAEVRKVLEKTTSRHMDGAETSVDKRVVSQLLAKYIHAFIEQRKEAEDMLKVLSGLLNWDEATQELAGLLPGPNNPHPPGSGPRGQHSNIGGLFGWRRGKAAGTAAAAAASIGQGRDGDGKSNATSTSKSGLASLWVEFLLKESAGGGGGAAAPPTPSAPSDGPASDAAALEAPSATECPAATTTPTEEH